jgi:hypothetical protein
MNFNVTGDISGPGNLTIIIITAYGRKREAAGVARVVYEHGPRHCAGTPRRGIRKGGRNVSGT